MVLGNFQCRGVLSPTVLSVGAGGVDWIFALVSIICLFLSETVRHGLKYCLKGPLNP